MAPGILLNDADTAPTYTQSKKTPNNSAPWTIFPDGIRTSGQHAPIYSRLKSYENFPHQITGPTVWKAEDYQNHPERWVHRFTEEEKAELGAAADDFIASGLPLTGMTKENFKLPLLSKLMDAIREDVINGKGFHLMKGFPVEEWGVNKSAVAYIGLGTYLGYFVSQNGKGHILGHVQVSVSLRMSFSVDADMSRLSRTSAMTRRRFIAFGSIARTPGSFSTPTLATLSGCCASIVRWRAARAISPPCTMCTTSSNESGRML